MRLGKLKKTSKKQKSVHTLKTDAERKAFLHPTRSKIISLLVKAPATISQISKKLAVHPANITHHFRLLERHNIIFLANEIDHGSYIEKYYLCSAKEFDIIPPPGSINSANAKVLRFLRKDLSEGIAELAPDDSDQVIGLIKRANISEKSFHRFAKRMLKLVEQYSQADEDSGKSYSLNLSLYPANSDYGPLRKIWIEKKG